MNSPDNIQKTPLAGSAPNQGPEERSALITRLFREHNESLIRYLALRLKSQEEAKEVAQEAYVRLLNLDRPGAIGFLRAFLFRTATNLAIDRIRHEQTSRQLARTGRFLEEFGPGPSPEQSVAGEQECDWRKSCSKSCLPNGQRAFFLHKICGLGFSEIAAQMGLRERMVRNYVVRAVLYCRAGLEAAKHEDNPRPDSSSKPGKAKGKGDPNG